jgi:hypothetical protein
VCVFGSALANRTHPIADYHAKGIAAMFRSGDRLSPSSAPLRGALTDHLQPEKLGIEGLRAIDGAFVPKGTKSPYRSISKVQLRWGWVLEADTTQTQAFDFRSDPG